MNQRSRVSKLFLALVMVLVLGMGLPSAQAVSAYTAPRLEKPAEEPTGLSDPEVSKAWHLDAIGARQAWKYGKGNKKTFLALVDSGVDYRQRDLASNLVWNDAEWPLNGVDDDHNGFVDDVLGWDFVKPGTLPFDRSGHGTFLATIAVSVEGNGVGTVGVCPQCGLLPVRFMNWEGLGDTDDAIAGIRYAIKRGASVINSSFSGEGYDKDMEKSIREAGAKDILVVVAASNDGENVDRTDTYPAKFNLPNQITVAAVNSEGDLSTESNWGKHSVHVAAPGVDMMGLWEGKWDPTGEGTSDAAVVVSAAATLLRSIAPELSAIQVKEVFMKTVKKYPQLENKVMSGGMIDLAAAVKCVKEDHLACLANRSTLQSK